jgi:hypothetical protein
LFGKTDASLVLANVQPSNTGLYDVVVTNALGSATSTGAFLSIGFPTPPSIVIQPVGATVPVGGTVSFTVQATGVPSPFYQWLHFGTNLSGATTSSLQLTNVQVVDAGRYSVFVSNSSGSITSQVAILTVGDSNIIASLIISSAAISVSWNALVGRDYQVQFKDGFLLSSWSNLPPVITATNITASTTDSRNKVQQRFYRVELLQQLNIAPTITVQPVSQTVSPGANVTFSVTATGSAPLSYQWRFNGNDLAGQNSATLQLNNVQSTDTGIYDVVVSNSAGSDTSDSAFLIVF